MASRVTGAGLACVVMLGVLAGCGGDGGGGEGLPTRVPTISPTRTLPAPTRTPTRTDEPSSEPTSEPTEQPTSEPTDQPTSEPTDQPTSEPTEQPASEPTEQPTSEPTKEPTKKPTKKPTREPSTEPTQSETEAVESPTSEPTEESTGPPSSPTDEAAQEPGQSDDESVPAWVWWLLVAVLLAAGVLAWVLIARSRRRRAWLDRLQAAEVEVAWLARDLLPQLRSAGSLDRATGGWQVAAPRVAAAEDQLTVLESSAPGEPSGARARALRDAVRRARARMEQLAGAGPERVYALDVDDAIADLEAALAPQEAVAP
jgi:hypothetical protein